VTTQREESSPELENLLEYLRANRGFDFTGYRRTGLARRISKRLHGLDLTDFSEYQDYLEVHPGEFAELFNTMLINVTGFLRDREAWDYVAGELVPALLAGKGDGEPIRVWSAGCASGQEAISLVMVLAEALGADQTRERVKVYATDVDEDALDTARQARYSPGEVEGVPAELLERYFEQDGGGFSFDQDLRRSVIFGRHDLTKDAPISRIDLIVCRNTLMYFNAETQSRILERLHYGLRDTGILFLGKAETLPSHASLFTPVDLQRRVFRRVTRSTLRDRLLMMTDTYSGQLDEHARGDGRLAMVAFQTGPDAQVVVDASGTLTAINDRARTLFKIPPSDLGRPFHDLDLSFRPVELRSRIEEAYTERRAVVVRDVEWSSVIGLLHLDVQVVPLIDREGQATGISITFNDVSRYRQLGEEVEHANRELETAYAELQSTNEELETTNEELQSTIEELETTNEELQSTNEELETMNEELQLTNEELQTINDELGRRTGELNEVNAYLESILSSFRGGVVVLDEDLRVRVWNHLSEDLWGVRPDEAQGQYFLNLDIGLPMRAARTLLQTALAGSEEPLEQVLDAVNRRGRPVRVRVACNALRGSEGRIRGVFVLLEPELNPEPAEPGAEPAETG
jgi:two-component system, chemotaxis family, CheB/CheR fusion protein